MPNTIRDLKESFRDDDTCVYFEKNVSIPIPNSEYPIRCNVYRPLSSLDSPGAKLPVIMTYGPYGKDIEYAKFHPESFSEVEPEQRSKYSAWETPDPVYWTRHGYAIVRCDERGFGQSPGYLDSMSNDTAAAFCHAIEWAASQPWSNGKVGLLGVSYYAGTQWRAAARQPKGLTCIIPWEGMSDYYRDRCRHGGIMSDGFIRFWWNRQVITNQYGRPGRAAAGRGEDTLEGDLSDKEREANRRDQNIDNEVNRFLDQEYYASRAFDPSDIKIPLLSAANLGNIGLHLRGNVMGFILAQSEFKYMRFLAGRHDLPFYYKEEVELQRSFLDAWLKGQDSVGWSVPGKVAPISLLLRKGDKGHNNATAEREFERRDEHEWPLARTRYDLFHLTPSGTLTTNEEMLDKNNASELSYQALGNLESPSFVEFSTGAVTEEIEITGHLLAHLNVSVVPSNNASAETRKMDLDLSITIRHLDSNGKEIVYTGPVGDPMPVTKGWLRCSLRAINENHPHHRPYLPYREYSSQAEDLLTPNGIYEVDVEIWPTNIVLEKGHSLVMEVSSGDTKGSGLFSHNNPVDRSPERFEGVNRIHFGAGRRNYLKVPVIPQ